jgi:hypothetical protein
MTARRRGAERLFVCCVVLLVVAGCVGGPQNRRVTGTGTPATLSGATQEATGLTLEREANETLETRVETTLSGDVSVRSVVEVNVTTPVREYRRDDGVVVGVVSTPAVRPVENRPVYRDPLAERSTGEQADYAQSRYGVAAVGAGERVRNVTLLGNETPLERFDAAARGEPVTVSLTRGRDGDDFVTLVVVAPVGRDVDVARIAAGVEH